MTELIILVGYFSLLLTPGIASHRLFRGTAEDFMLASHTVGACLLRMALFGTTMTAFALIGSTGRAYTLGVGGYGLLASASGIVHSLCFFVVGVPLWSLGRRFDYSTQIQFFRDRLDNDFIGVLLFPILVGISGATPAPGHGFWRRAGGLSSHPARRSSARGCDYSNASSASAVSPILTSISTSDVIVNSLVLRK